MWLFFALISLPMGNRLMFTGGIAHDTNWTGHTTDWLGFENRVGLWDRQDRLGTEQVQLMLRCRLMPTHREGSRGCEAVAVIPKGWKNTRFFVFFLRTRLCVYFVCNVYLFMSFWKNLKNVT